MITARYALTLLLTLLEGVNFCFFERPHIVEWAGGNLVLLALLLVGPAVVAYLNSRDLLWSSYSDEELQAFCES